MTFDIKECSSVIINTRIKRVYTPIKDERDRNYEKTLKKFCVRCKNLKKHSEFRIGYDYEDNKEKTVKGLWRNNNCIDCEREATTGKQKDTVFSLKRELETLKELVNKNREEALVAKEKNDELFQTALTNLAAATNNTIQEDGTVVKNPLLKLTK